MHGPLGRQVLRHMANARLGNIVSDLRLREVGAVRRDARREQDAASAVGAGHVPRGSLRAQERARKVHINDVLELSGGGLDGGHAAHDAREAAEGGNAAMRRCSGGECGLHGAGVRDVALVRRDIAVAEVSLQLGDGCCGGLEGGREIE